MLPLRFTDYRVAHGEHFDRESSTLEVMAHQAGNVRIVFDHKDAWFHGEYCNVATLKKIKAFTAEHAEIAEKKRY
jgi:hypothetical protein